MPGYSYKFLNSLRRRHVCGLCQLPMRDPVVISICGHRYCDTCLQEFLSAGIFKCPEDQQLLDYATIYPDAAVESEIMDMRVSCLHQAGGCSWNDKMFNLKAHLESCSFDMISCPNKCPAQMSAVAMQKHVKYTCPKRLVMCDHCKTEFTEQAMENHEGNCQFEMVWCENKCGARLQQRYLSNHMNNECHKRTQGCRYCGKHFVYETLQDHYYTCQRYPVPCPNRCDPMKIPREDLEHHVRESCPSSTVPCPFQHAGCKHLCPRYSLDRHLEDQMKSHLALMCTINSSHERQLNSLIRQLSNLSGVVDGNLIWKIDNIKNRLNLSVNLNSSISSSTPPRQEQLPPSSNASTVSSTSPPQLHPRLSKLNGGQNVLALPVNCVRSPAFYTHRYGYKLVASVFPNGHASGNGSHLSVYIGVVKGDYDNLLEWPFRYPITFTLLDQCADTEKRQHLSESFLPNPSWKQFQKPVQTTGNSLKPDIGDTISVVSRGTNASDIIPISRMDVTDQAMGFGYPKFVSHDLLKHGAFIKDDSLFLKISVDNSTFVAP